MSLKKVSVALAMSIAFTIFISFLLLQKGAATEAASLTANADGSLMSEPIPLLHGDKDFTFYRSLGANFKSPPEDLQLLIGTYDRKFIEISRAELVSETGGCLYRVESGTILQNNTHLLFKKIFCDQFVSQFKLEIQVNEPSQLALWTFLGDSSTQGLGPRIRINGTEVSELNRIHFLYGFYSVPTANPNARRFQLLRHMWNSPLEESMFFSVIILFCFLFSYSLMFFLMSKNWAIAAIISWAALACYYSILIPPFHAPDEPDHALSFADLLKDRAVSDGFLKLSQIGHFEKIKFYSHHKFTSSDALVPSKLAWSSHIAAPDMKSRSLLTVKLWSVFELLSTSHNPGVILLSLRIFHSILIALSLGVAIFLSKDAFDHSKIFVILLMLTPSLPFFSMHISNYFTTIMLSLVQSGILIAVLNNRFLKVGYVALIALVISMAPFSSSAAVGLLIPWLFVISHIASTNLQNIPRYSKISNLTQRYVVCIIILITFYNLIGAEIRPISMIPWESLLVQDEQLMSKYERTFGVSVFLFLAFFVLNQVETLAPKMWKRTLEKIVFGLSRGFIFLILSATVYGAIFYSFFSEHVLPNIESSDNWLNPLKYTKEVMISLIAMFNLAHSDFLFSSSYWVGFGWLEAMPSQVFILSVRAIMNFGLVVYFVYLLLKAPFFEVYRASLFLFGMIFFLCVLAWMASKNHMNLHGRYLICFYLSLVPFSALGWSSVLGRKFVEKWMRPFESTATSYSIASVILIIHGYCSYFLLERYF